MVQDAAGDAGGPNEHGELTRVTVRRGEGESALGIGLLIEPHVGITEGVCLGRCSPKGGVEANGVSEVVGGRAPLARDVLVVVHRREKSGGETVQARGVRVFVR
eukprot:scaffold122526_cov55-Phaeocystis_antarctica.AAC.2